VELEEDIAILQWSLRRYCNDIAKHNYKTLATFNTRYDFVPLMHPAMIGCNLSHDT